MRPVSSHPCRRQILPHVRDLFAAMRLIQTTARAGAGLKSGQVAHRLVRRSSSLKLLRRAGGLRRALSGVDVFVTEKSDPEIEQTWWKGASRSAWSRCRNPVRHATVAVDEMVAVLPPGMNWRRRSRRTSRPGQYPLNTDPRRSQHRRKNVRASRCAAEDQRTSVAADFILEFVARPRRIDRGVDGVAGEARGRHVSTHRPACITALGLAC